MMADQRRRNVYRCHSIFLKTDAINSVLGWNGQIQSKVIEVNNNNNSFILEWLNSLKHITNVMRKKNTTVLMKYHFEMFNFPQLL